MRQCVIQLKNQHINQMVININMNINIGRIPLALKLTGRWSVSFFGAAFTNNNRYTLLIRTALEKSSLYDCTTGELP